MVYTIPKALKMKKKAEEASEGTKFTKVVSFPKTDRPTDLDCLVWYFCDSTTLSSLNLAAVTLLDEIKMGKKRRQSE